MNLHLGEQVQYGDTADNQQKPDNGAHVGCLLEKEHAAQCDESDTKCRPSGVCNADGNCAQAKAEQVQRRYIAQQRKFCISVVDKQLWMDLRNRFFLLSPSDYTKWPDEPVVIVLIWSLGKCKIIAFCSYFDYILI